MASKKCLYCVSDDDKARNSVLWVLRTQQSEQDPDIVSIKQVHLYGLVNGLLPCSCLQPKDEMGSGSSIYRVTEELTKNEWVHFACHHCRGLPDRTHPFKSAFTLQDGRLTIKQIIGCDLKNPEFAYLSACHTTVGDDSDKDSTPDEAIHLASAMQFAGFRSVIGTMWAVGDGKARKITSTFYKHMVDESGCLDHTRAAFALHKTMKSVRIPFDQRISYMHVGV